jgi:hypothetical protein
MVKLFQSIEEHLWGLIMCRTRLALLGLFLAITFWLSRPPTARAYIGGPPLSLGMMCWWSTHVMIAKVERLDRDKNIILFRKVRDIKGKWPTDLQRHVFQPGFGSRQHIFEWAEPGKTVVMCALESYKWSHTYIDGEWYASNTPDWTNWTVSHSEPLLLRMYAGKTDRLADAVTQICAGREVVVPGMVDGPLEDLVKRRAKFQRLKSSMKLLDYNPKRDFVGLGNDDFAPLVGMPGFTQAMHLAKLGSDVQAIASADFDGDAKPDLCLAGAHRVAVFLNGGDYFHQTILPGFEGGCRAAVAADYNGDGKADLFLATVTGPRLFTSLGDGNFRDDTALLPKEAIYNLTAAAWLDYDCDGWPDLLLANGYHGLRLYRNNGKPPAAAPTTKPPAKPAPGKPAPPPTWFEDRSDHVGLGEHGPGAGAKGETLAIADIDGDGYPDFLYGADNGMLFLNAPHGFMPVTDRGIAFAPDKVGPAFGDFDGDGVTDLFVPQNGVCRLFKGLGKARFADVTQDSGDLAKPFPWATSAAWGDFDNDGHLDLVVGCLKGPNRYFRNKGDGTFEDRTEQIGLHRKLFNTQALCLVDLNGDGGLDMVLNNERQEAVVLLGNAPTDTKRAPVTLFIGGNDGVVGGQVQILDMTGKFLKGHAICGGGGRTQSQPQARFILDPGTYRVEVRYSSGSVRARDIRVAGAPVRGAIDERTPRVE